MPRECRAELLEGRPGIAHERTASELGGVAGADVDVHDLNVGVLEDGARGSREIGVARADPEHEIGVARDEVGCTRARGADRPERERVTVGESSLPGLRLRDRHPGLLDERAERVGRVGVVNAAPGDDEGRARPSEHRGCALEGGGVGKRPADVPGARLDQLDREVVGLGLHVLGQAQRDGAGLGGIGQDAHRLEQRRPELLGPVDPVPVARDGAERVVDRDVAGPAGLELLEDGIDPARGEDITWQQQHR